MGSVRRSESGWWWCQLGLYEYSSGDDAVHHPFWSGPGRDRTCRIDLVVGLPVRLGKRSVESASRTNSMGIFSRKNSRPSAHTETLSIETDGSRLSNVSTAKSPLFARDSHSSWLSPISSTSPSEPALSNPRVIDPAADPAAYLRTLPAVRERSRLVFQKARTNELAHFDVDLEKLSETAKYVVSIIKACSSLDRRRRRRRRRCFCNRSAPEGPRAGLFGHTAVGTMATLRCWRSTSNRPAASVVAVDRRPTRTHPSSHRLVLGLRSVGRRRRGPMAVQEQAIRQDIPTQRRPRRR